MPVGLSLAAAALRRSPPPARIVLVTSTTCSPNEIRRRMMRDLRGRSISAALLPLLLVGACLFYTRVSRDDVQQAIASANIVGESYASVVSKLQQIQLPHGRRLELCGYDPGRGSLCAVVRNASKDWMTTWTVAVRVLFDGRGRAKSFEVYNSADSPL